MDVTPQELRGSEIKEAFRGYHRDEVLGAFNDVSQLAPRASQQPLLMNALLRKHLQQGSIDPFDATNILGAEKGLMETGAIPTPPQAGGTKKVGPSSTSVLAK